MNNINMFELFYIYLNLVFCCLQILLILNQLIEFCVVIQACKSFFRSQYMEKMRKQVGHELNQLEAYFEQRNDRFRQEILFVCGHHQIKNLHQNVQAAKTMIKKYLKIPNQQNFCQKLKLIQTKMSQVVQDACIEIRRIIFNLKNTHNQSSDILLNSAKFSHYQFSQTLKHSSIQLRNTRSLALNKHFDNVYHSCVVTPSLSPFHPSITFQIKKSQHKCVWLGISSLQVLTKMNFENVYKGNGPNYWIWQAGGDEEAEIYSQNSENRPLVGWNFEAGDKVTLKVAYQENGKKFLHIIKNQNEQEKFSLQINENIGSYYPCISLGDESQSVAIVNQQF